MILNGIKKRLGDFVLDIDNLEIKEPGIYGLIGPNGSGKSTLAKIMSGLMNPDQGSIDTCGLNQKDITFLGRKPYLLDDSVLNNLLYPLKLRNIMGDTGLVEDYLERMGLSSRRKQRARLLSGGEQQKLSFLRALIFKPRLIITDEAMTAMDIDSLDLFENLLLDVQKQDPVIWIIISHQIAHIKRLTSYLYFMNQGKIETEGSTEALLNSASNFHLGQYLRIYGGSI